MKDKSFLTSNYIAHRGVYDNKRIYENTISAFNRAIKYGLIIECDVRLLIDGTIICFHDEDTEKLLNMEGKIENNTYEELCYIAKYQIPTLESVLETVDGKVPIIIEMKSISKGHNFENLLAKLLDNYNGPFAIQSFNKKNLKWFLKNRTNYVIGYLINKKNMKHLNFSKKCDFLAIDINLLDTKKIKKLREDNTVIGYTIYDKVAFDTNKVVYDNLIVDNVLEILTP